MYYYICVRKNVIKKEWDMRPISKIKFIGIESKSEESMRRMDWEWIKCAMDRKRRGTQITDRAV